MKDSKKKIYEEKRNLLSFQRILMTIEYLVLFAQLLTSYRIIIYDNKQKDLII